MRTLFLFAGAMVFSYSAFAAELSANEIIKKSEAAYAALKTYVGTTTVRENSDIGGTKLETTSTSKVTFKRPGKFHITGTTASPVAFGKPGSAFTLVSDGKTTWKSWALQDNGAFKEVRDLQMAGMGGVARGAAETIASALMKSDGAWTGGSDPFITSRVAGTKLEGHEKIDGADCYKLVSKSPTLGDVTYWIDSKSFLLRQMRKELSEKQLAEGKQAAEASLKAQGKELPATPPNATPKFMSHTFSFKNEALDGNVDEKLFANPMKK